VVRRVPVALEGEVLGGGLGRVGIVRCDGAAGGNKSVSGRKLFDPSRHSPRAALLPISSKYSSATRPSMLPAAKPLLRRGLELG
jgi:hypothetical protein